MKISCILNSSMDKFQEEKTSFVILNNLKLPFPSVRFSSVFLTLKCEPLVLFTIAAPLNCLTFEDFCLGLTFSLGPRDPKRFGRAE